MEQQPTKTALISVFDKTGIEDFAQQLVELGWDILASGGTAKFLIDHGVPVRDVADLVGGGAILGHRVVTLSREIHAGLLARDTDEDRAELERLGIPRIDLVCVDLYPLEAAMAAEGATEESIIESTDIGGPALLRSAAKGRRIVVSQARQRQMVLDWLESDCPAERLMLNHLAAEAEFVCAKYALKSAECWSGGELSGKLGRQQTRLKYGENPWQTPAALYSTETDDRLALTNFEQVAGARMGYCNYTDMDRLVITASLLAATLAKNGSGRAKISVGVKHGNPCGAAYHNEACDAARMMLDGDPRAIFGGAVIVNYGLTIPRARNLFTHGMPSGKFRKIDLVVAPAVSKSALAFIKERGCRLMINCALFGLGADPAVSHARRLRQVRGGMLVQPAHDFVLDFCEQELEAHGQEKPKLVTDLALAWAVGSSSNSNTVCLVRDGKLIGNGCGQQDRVTVCQHAVAKAVAAGHQTKGSVAYSDSFFPFVDGPEVLVAAGVDAVITCSGSVRDKDVLDYFQANRVTVYTIPHTMGRGFFGH